MRSLFRFLFAVILAAFFFAGPAEAHSFRFPAPSISADPIVSSDSPSCIIPFTRVGNLILIQASIDTTTGYFVLDTGTPGLVLNITYFRRYATSHTTEGGGVTGFAGFACRTNIDSLRLGPVRYFRLEADLIDLGHIENNKGVKILGLLGMTLFQRFEMIIDYSARLIFLHQIARRGPAVYRNLQLTDTSTYQTIPIQIEDGKIIVYVYVNGKRLKFIIDSGAETNVLDSRLPNLGPGDYQYGFFIDGNWIKDPANSLYVASRETHLVKSFLIVQPNYTFRLQGHADAKQVCLAGDFSDWTPDGLKMTREGDAWIFPIHLSYGKHLYKFIIDGKWVRDPDNPLWEGNAYDSDNSVLWMEDR